MNNGPRKGGAAQTFEILGASTSLKHLWQNHYSIPAGAGNQPERFIATCRRVCRSRTVGPFTWAGRTGSARRRAVTARSR